MQRMTTAHRLIALAAGLFSLTAHAHTGHGTTSLMEGLIHPFGPDHLLAMVAVGVWSITNLQAHNTWRGPAIFMLSLLAGAMLGMTGFALPYLEHAVTLSVMVLGALLVQARNRPSSHWIGLMLIAVAGWLHGLAHGSEAPGSGLAGYALGFLFTTAALHVMGIAIGVAIQGGLFRGKTWLLNGMSAGLSLTSLYLFTQL
jgi:urease accessory protein